MANNEPVNVKAKVKDGNLFLKIDLSEDYGPSSTGRSHTVAGARWLKLDDVLEDSSLEGFKLNLQVIKPVPKKRARAESFDDDLDFDSDEKPAPKKLPVKKAAGKAAVTKRLELGAALRRKR